MIFQSEDSWIFQIKYTYTLKFSQPFSSNFSFGYCTSINHYSIIPDPTAIMYTNQDPILAASSSGTIVAQNSRTVSPQEVIFQMEPRNGIAKYDMYMFQNM